MEKFQPISERVVAEAKDRKEQLTDQALKCHDRLVANERELGKLQREVEAIRSELDNLVKKIEQECGILAFDPEHDCVYLNSENYYGFKNIAPEKKWTKDILLTVFYWLFRKSKKVGNSFWGESTWWEEQISESIRNDSDVIFGRLCTCDRNYFWDDALFLRRLDRSERFPNRPHPSSFIPKQFWNDKSFVVEALTYFPEALVLEETTLGQASLLNDPDVFAAFLAVSCREPSMWEDVHFRQLVLRFSFEIRSNADLMLALVRKCGLCLEYVNASLRVQNPEILRAACVQNINAWEHVLPGDGIDALLQDKSFALQMFGCGEFYDSLPVWLQGDREIVDLVLGGGEGDGIFTLQDFPDTVPRTRDFWLGACGNIAWVELPEEFRGDPEFAVRLRFKEVQEIHQYLQVFPQFAENRSFWISVVESHRTTSYGFLHTVIPSEMRQDRELMMLACQNEPEVFGILGAEWQQEREFLEIVVKDSGALRLIPPEVQVAHPDLTIEAIQVEERDLSNVAVDLLSNAEVAKAIFENYNYDVGFAEFPDQLPDSIKDNEDFGLFTAKYCDEKSEFEKFTSVTLRSNKEFMKRAVALNPKCLASGENGLAEDFDVAVMAFSKHIYSLHALFPYHEDDNNYDYKTERELLYSTATEARERVIAFEGFTQGFLFCLGGKHNPNCHLPMLIRDDATTKGLKELIASFVGVPERDEVDRLRVVSLHLLFACWRDPTLNVSLI